MNRPGFAGPSLFGLKTADDPSNFSIVFDNGTFSNFAGNGLIFPSPLIGVDSLSFGSNFSVFHNFGTAGATNEYLQFSSSGPFPVNQTTGVPEPGALALFGVGLLGIAAVTRRRRKVA